MGPGAPWPAIRLLPCRWIAAIEAGGPQPRPLYGSKESSLKTEAKRLHYMCPGPWPAPSPRATAAQQQRKGEDAGVWATAPGSRPLRRSLGKSARRLGKGNCSRATAPASGQQHRNSAGATAQLVSVPVSGQPLRNNNARGNNAGFWATAPVSGQLRRSLGKGNCARVLRRFGGNRTAKEHLH